MSKKRRVDTIHFKLHSAQAILRISTDHTAKLTNLFSHDRRRGHASELMEDIVSYADKHKISIWLEAQRYGSPIGGLNNSQLVSFYEKFGFDILDDERRPVLMGRNPLLKGETE